MPVFAPGPFRSAGLYSTAIAKKHDGVSPRASFGSLGHAGNDPWREKKRGLNSDQELDPETRPVLREVNFNPC